MINKIFTNNEHFVEMMNIINEARSNPPSEGHRHHIIPRCWFTLKNLDVDNSDKNLVLLSYDDHVKVHELMYHCCKSKIMKRKMSYAYTWLSKGKIVENGCFKGENNPNFGKKASQETRMKMSVVNKGENNPNFGKKASQETRMKMSENNPSKRPDVRRKISEANRGKVMSEESRRKMSEAKKGKEISKEHRKKISESMKGKSWKLVNGKRIYSDSKIVV